MANEFIIKNGAISRGSLIVSGSLSVSGAFSASLQQGYIWVGGGNNTAILISSSSLGGGGSSSGTSGNSGSSGTSGSTGSSGTSGANGSSGTSGANGANGSSGTSGANGVNGSSGTAGSTGSTGTSGSTGSSGTSGANGANGSSGTSGQNGSSGTSGANGANGSSGTSGVSGANGSSGTSGVSGANGSSGTSGQNGSSGTSGVSGANGSSGTSGANGANGSSGTSGAGFTTITNAADNRVLTSDGGSNTANAEANLTFNGNILSVLNPSSGQAVLQLRNSNASGFTGTEYFDSAGNVDAYIGLEQGGGGSRYNAVEGSHTFYMNGTARVAISGSEGNVGIGTTSPLVRLDVRGTTIITNQAGSNYDENIRLPEATSGYASIALGGSIATSGTSAAQWTILKYPTNNNFAIRNNATDLLYIKTTGEVGIGTTSPAYKLTVYNDITGNGTGGTLLLDRVNNVSYENAINFATAGTKKWFFGMDNDSTENLYLYKWDGTGLGFIMTFKDGNVGIGNPTNITQKLQVEGVVVGGLSSTTGTPNTVGITNQLAFEARSTGAGNEPAIAFHKEGVYTFYLQGQNSQRGLRLLSPTSETAPSLFVDGNVGVGTTNPGHKLSVTGSSQINGALSVGAISPSTTTGRIDASNDIVAYSTSDIRLKENIIPINNALNKVLTLNGVGFDWKPELKHIHGYEHHDVGIIAQDVEKVLPEAVRTNITNYLAVRYEKLVPLLIEAIKEQNEKIEKQNRQIEELIKIVEELKNK